MVPHIPPYITLTTTATQIIIVVAVWRIIASAAARSTLTPATRRRIRTAGATFLPTWLATALFAAPSPQSLLHQGAFRVTPLIGLLAPIVAWALARRAGGARSLAVAWNVAGLLDLCVAVGMGTGVLATAVLPHSGERVPPAAAMGVFPMILVPAFAVPLSVLLHVWALARLRGEGRRVSRSVPLATLSPTSIGTPVRGVDP
jgi:hypothetical protein